MPMLIIVSGLASAAGIDIGGLLFELCAAIAVLAGLIWLLSRRQRMHLPFRTLLLRYPRPRAARRHGDLRARRGA